MVDDYAHHPTEVRATIAAARTLDPRRVVAVFQPHLFSRTRHQYREFGQALAEADVVAVLDVYPARERAEDFPGRHRPARGRGGRPSRGRPPVAWLPGFDEAAVPAGAAARGGPAVDAGAGDVDASRLSAAARRLAAALRGDESGGGCPAKTRATPPRR